MASEEMTSQLGGSGDNVDDSIMQTNRTANDDENISNFVLNGTGIGNPENADEDENDDTDSMPALIDAHPSHEMSPSNYTAKTLSGDQHVDKTKDDNKEPNIKENGNLTQGEDTEWMDVVGSGQLRKKVLRAGQGVATRPVRGQLVTVQSKGSLEDGTEVDCNQEISFVLGEGDVVTAWDLCLSLMDVGEVAIIETSPRFAYGEIGRSPDIPPNADLTYEVELLDVQPAPDPECMTVDQLCKAGDKKRERGNELYTRKDYSGAINSYTKALKVLEAAKVSKDDEATKQTVSDLRIKCYNNLAAAQLKIDAYMPALQSCANVLDLDPENVKALFRKGKVLACQGEYEQAVKTMKDALTREPSNKVIHQELSSLTSQESKERESERQLYQRMVGEIADITKVNPKKSSNKKWFYAAVSIAVVILAVIAAISTQELELIF